MKQIRSIHQIWEQEEEPGAVPIHRVLSFPLWEGTLSAHAPSSVSPERYTLISPTDRRLTEEVTIFDEWCPVDQSGPIILIADRYTFLKEFTQQIILGLWERDHAETARRLATCGLRGSVYKKCKKGKRARAHRHTCHCWICEYCGQSKNLLRVWLRGRRYELRTEPQRGIEVTGPVDDYRFNVQLSLFGRWLKDKQGIDAVCREEVEAQPTVNRVRMVLHTDKVPYREALEYLRRITHDAPGYSIRIHDESTPTALLQWMFASTEAVLSYCGNTRARLFAYYYRRRMLKTYGDFYAPVKDLRSLEVDEEYAEDTPSVTSMCNCGQCDGIMETIPWNERTTESVEHIEEKYEHVDWSCSYDPFRIKRNQGQITVNSAHLVTETTPSGPSPPH
jgi:hypothetical protein